MTTVVLGWDGLDHQLAMAWELVEAFGPHHRSIETFDNPVLEKPHTYELWPSIVTGVGPNEHGIYAATAEGGTDWESDWVSLAARLSTGLVPERIRTEVGRRLRNRGATLDFKPASYYRDRGIETIFDGRRSLAFAVPNYRTRADDRLDVVFDRGAQLGEFLHIEEGADGASRHRPKIPVTSLEDRLAAETTKKLGAIEAAMQREYDLVFAWLGFLDTVGHLAPAVDEAGWQHRWYRQAARWTSGIREQLGADDILVCVSDHGLRSGQHTHDAFLGATDERVLEGTDSVLDVADAIDRVTPRRESMESPPVADRWRVEGDEDAESAAAIRDRLEDLGYL
ncbi:hypothetical protein C479_03571 [Halovivax asiaticus JCM 14624]|uniref:Type I phosphodiesterase/nucleotide pyrophosphatase n=1 Tax=Halovivax asiaticus JCM 14624 TaxID=1227490 RepID=M0BU18_9EURY|nr:alkaline phosphatase family protein [Halovivax asiaticus]ELZ13893.1 hypothetical protein C479_03571 [Halovivax asiaticus JCM 14624]